ncbi:DUF881 domain-containing protein [Jatrophihabitans telluris]|uniref:DUF881 domain-containing protein n=1 Tax=Jatrophihabitans telluris TaxID=2038343 RepID=A0ABY4R2I6_9ACTN|nr:DUF881 domain-containing protein [Jatrophihabitans telluris]UQX90131.1 DUF881 domain-containing protein [Jatrophihabitans telluris]
MSLDRTEWSRSTLTSAVLDDLLNNTLDPGYRAAATAPKRPHWWDRPAVVIVCLSLGLLLAVSYQQSHLSAPARDTARKDLITRIHSLQAAGSSLDARARTLASDVAGLRDQQLSPSDNSALRQLEVTSGSVQVKGPGLRVTLAEPATPQASAGQGRPGTGSKNETAVIKDRDVRSVVNQLWASGAEAIAVNGIRITATSAIRFAGESILVDFQTINSPYVIEAIGDRNALDLGFADSAAARALKTTQAVYGIGFTFDTKSSLTLPSVTVGQQSYATSGASSVAPSRSSSGPSDGSTARTSSSPTPTASESPR